MRNDTLAALTVSTVITVLVVCFIGIGTMLQVRTDNNNRAYVQAICDWSHTHQDGGLEERCGQAQDKTHTEYLCATRSSNLNCWVEVKN
jgi:hypothetical protein